MAFTINTNTGFIPVTLTLADSTKFELGDPIIGDGIGGNDGKGIVVGKDGNDVTVKVSEGTFVATNGVDDRDPFVAPDTTISAVVTEDAVIFQRVSKGEARGVGIMAYLDYTKAGADALQLQFAYNEQDIDGLFYQEIAVVNDALELMVIDVTASGNYRIPIAIADNEDSVKVIFAGTLGDGTANIEFRPDQGHK